MNANVSISALADSQIKEVERLMVITDNAKVREIERMKAKGYTQSKNISFWEGLKVAFSFGYYEAEKRIEVVSERILKLFQPIAQILQTR